MFLIEVVCCRVLILAHSRQVINQNLIQLNPFLSFYMERLLYVAQAILEQGIGFPNIPSDRILAVCEQPTWHRFMSVLNSELVN